VKGDSRSASIAAASIIAKVTRDRFMTEQEKHYPKFSFGRHKGYGTAQHLEELKSHGPTPLHRRSFAPVQAQWSLNF
jgi:ribonuclease HII